LAVSVSFSRRHLYEQSAQPIIVSSQSRPVRATLLGIAQDGGRPQAGCFSECCSDAYNNPELVRHPVSLGIVGSDYSPHLIEASRDLAWQFGLWKSTDPTSESLASIWLTHAHFGHVDGLGLFGKEAIAARGLPLHCSTSFARLLGKNAIWQQMLNEGVLAPRPFVAGKPVQPLETCGFSIIPIPIPHRNELSDMHAFLICGGQRRLLFLPDHDTWEETLESVGHPDLRSWLNELAVDIALLDGTFFSSDELSTRRQEDVPHPPVIQTLELLGQRQSEDARVIFIHLNHTNPLHSNDNWQTEKVTSLGWEIGYEGMVFDL